MKRCPDCGRDYNDDSLSYCLDDGSELLFGPAFDDPRTAIFEADDPTSEARTRPQIHTTNIPSDPGSTIDSGSRPFDKRLLLAPVALAAIVLAGFAGYRYLSSTGSKQIDSIAVMPFVNESGNPDIEYLSDGIAETLISSLSQLSDLTVKPRSSVFRYKGKNLDAPIVGKELNVQTILTGTVVQRGSDIGLHVELVDSATDRVLWSKDYLRPLANLVNLQSEIAREVSSELKTKLSGAEEQKLTKQYTENAQAYQLYLLGRFHFNKRNKADVYKAIDFFRQAVDKDPNYALAYSGLSDVYAILQGYDPSVSSFESKSKGREYALKALSLDDSLSEAHVSMGQLLQVPDFDFEGAEREFKRAIELDPKNANAFASYAMLLMPLGRFDQAEANFRRALELEPATTIINRHYGNFLFIARRYNESEQHMRKTLELDPNSQLSYFTLANALQRQGKLAEAVEVYARSREIVGKNDEAAAMRSSFNAGGWRGFVLDFEKKDWLAPDFRAKYITACRLASIGENQMALDQLEHAFADREGFITLINVDPRLDPLRDEPRFKELLKKIGFPER